MVPVDEETLRDMLHEAGFKAMHRFWHIHPFLALVAEKGKDQASMTNSPGWANTRWMEAIGRRSGLNLN